MGAKLRSTGAISLALLALLTLAGPATAARLAMVVGNDTYLSPKIQKLRNARNDAKAIAAELEAAGFRVTRVYDATREQVFRALDGFIARVGRDDEVVFFFSGHGVQPAGLGPYLVPVDFRPEPRAIERDGLSLERLVDDFGRRARFSLVIVDACREVMRNTDGKTLVAEGSGISRIDPPKGTMVMLAASKGQQALDSLGSGDKVPNGVFTRELIRQMRVRGLPAGDMLKRVKVNVEKAAASVAHEQRPALMDESSNEFYFYPPAAAPVLASPAAPHPPLRIQPAAPVAPLHGQPAASPSPLRPAPAPTLQATTPAAAPSTPLRLTPAPPPVTQLLAMADALRAPGAQSLGDGLVFRPTRAGDGARPGAGDRAWVKVSMRRSDGVPLGAAALQHQGALRLQTVDAAPRCLAEGLRRMRVRGAAVLTCRADVAFAGALPDGVQPTIVVVLDVELVGLLPKQR